MDAELYQRCPICEGSGITLNPESPVFTTRCHGCKGEKYRLVGFNMTAIEQMIEDAREAHRYYQADGTAIHIESADEVRFMRVAAAKKIIALQQLCRNAGLSVSTEETNSGPPESAPL